MSKRWEQAASLILLARKQASTLTKNFKFDYQTLLLKRSPTMRFAPNASVFPGGKLDSSDLSMEWVDYLSSSMSLEQFRRKKADIYSDIDHPFPGLAFRLCAIRETFEETGLFFVVKNSPTVSDLTTNQISSLRKIIREDPKEFLQICKKNQMSPDVTSLFEWSQYLAPAFAKVRFDTIFYVMFRNSIDRCSIDSDDTETVSANWFDPDGAMRAYHQNSINFLPPQIFELSRLANFSKHSELQEFLSKRANAPDYQTKRILGVCYKLNDAVVIVMPDDDRYPADASFKTPVIILDQSLADFNSPNKYRLVSIGDGPKQKWRIQYQNSSTRKMSEYELPPLSDGWEIESKL